MLKNLKNKKKKKPDLSRLFYILEIRLYITIILQYSETQDSL